MKPMEVWKYELEIDDYIEIKMPIEAQVLYFDVQNEKPCIWVKVRPDYPTETRRFRFAGTGHPLDPKDVGEYIGSCQMMGGRLVWHLFHATKE